MSQDVSPEKTTSTSNMVVPLCPVHWLHPFAVIRNELPSSVAKFWFIREEGVISGSLESLSLITEPSQL